MKFLKSLSRSVAIVLFCGLLAPKSLSADDKNYILATLQSPDDLLPFLQYSGRTSALKSLLFPPILSVQPDGRVRCILCKDVPDVEAKRNKEKKETEYSITIELKKDLHWADGRDITADDIKFSLEMMAKATYPKGQAPILPIARIILNKEEKRKATLILRHRRSDAFQLFAISLLPEHRRKDLEAVWNDPVKARKLLKQPSFAYGPLKIEKAESNRWMLVSNSKTSWERQSDRPIELRFYSDTKTLSEAFSRNEIDQSDELEWNTYKQLLNDHPDLTEKYSSSSNPSSRMNVLLINLHSPLLVNPQLRQALFFAIDRKQINGKEFFGLAEEAEGVITHEFAERLEEKRVPSYQPQLAGQILDKAGWSKFEDHVRVAEGQKLALNLVCPAERSQGPWIEILKKNLEAQGIQLTVEKPNEEEFLKKVLSHRRFRDLACVAWDLPTLSVPNNLFHSLAIPTIDNDFMGLNYSAWDQNVVNRILDSMLRETDLPHFAKLFGRLDKMFLNELPAIPLVYVPRVTVSRKQHVVDDAPELQEDLATYPGSFVSKKKM